MTTGENTTPYIGLKTANIPPNVGDTANYSSNSLWDNNRVQEANLTYEGKFPSDVNYLYVYAGTNRTYNRLPISLIIEGFDYFDPAFKNIIKLGKDAYNANNKIETGLESIEYKLHYQPYGLQPSQMSLFKPTINLFSDFCYHYTRGYYRSRIDGYPYYPRITATANWQGWLIRVKPNTTYAIGPVDFKIEITKADGNLDKTLNGLSSTEPNIITTGADSYWLCLTQSISRDMSQWMMVEGDTYPSEYISGYPQLVAELLRPGESNTPKTVAFMGDSITAGVATAKCFHEYIHDKYGFICRNYGFGGSGYFRNSVSQNAGKQGTGAPGMGIVTTPETFFTPNNITSRLSELNVDNIDGIVIAAGTNDYGNNVSIADFRSGIESAFEYCKTNLTKCSVLVMTPIHRRYDTNQNTQGKTLIEYCDILIEECRKYGIAYVDTMAMSGLYPDNEANRILNFESNQDSGLHPGAEGHNRMATAIGEKLKELLSYKDLS